MLRKCWSQVAAGAFHTCTIAGRGHVLKCFGWDELGAVSIPTNLVNVKTLVVSAGRYHSCAISASNLELSCWGGNRYEQTSPLPQGVIAWLAVSAGGYHTCAIT